jgi:glycosyltransferase involved in cell wall biosynthesis
MTDAPGAPPPIVCFCGVDWWYHSRAHSDLQLMTRAARTRTVLLVNSLGMRMPRPGRTTRPFRRVLRKLASTLRYLRRPRADLPRFFVMTPVSLPVYAWAPLRRWNAALVRLQIRLVCRALGIRRPAVVVTVPTAWDVTRGLPRARLVYNRSDKHSAFAEADARTIERLERELLARADRVVYASRTLMAEERALTGARAFFLDHGVDLDLFTPQSAVEPPDMATIPHPRLGFFGGLRAELVDLALLEHTAQALPDASLCLVGDAPSRIDGLLRWRNVHWLGPKPHDAIPAYGRAFDVGLMPYRTNEWIRACNPIKLKEYLALGLPVVSTDFPAAREYAPAVAVGATPDEFVQAIRTALASTDAADRAPPAGRGRVVGRPHARAARAVRRTRRAAGRSTGVTRISTGRLRPSGDRSRRHRPPPVSPRPGPPRPAQPMARARAAASARTATRARDDAGRRAPSRTARARPRAVPAPAPRTAARALRPARRRAFGGSGSRCA